MKKRLFLKTLAGIGIILISIKILSLVLVEPWLQHKIQTAVNEKNKEYTAAIGSVKLRIFRSGIELKEILITSTRQSGNGPDLKAEIASVKFTGIKIFKAITKKDIDLDDIRFSNIRVEGYLPISGDSKPPFISPLNISIKHIGFENINLSVQDYFSSGSWLLNKGFIGIHNIKIAKQDSLSAHQFESFDIIAENIGAVSSDSMYIYKGSGIKYVTLTKSLSIDSFDIHPAYSNYEFSSRFKYQTDRIEGSFRELHFYDLMLEEFIQTGNVMVTFIEIGDMDLTVFRDKQKPFKHIIKLTFQEKIYNYPETIHIDSIGLKNGNVTYLEHAAQTDEAGRISFNKLNAKIYKVSNEAIYETRSAFLELNAEALFMGTGKLELNLKSELFNRNNTFSLQGILSDFQLSDMNPFLENNASLYASSGRLEKMDFFFTADNTKSHGNLIMYYKDFSVTVKNKQTNDTVAFREKFISLIANRKIIDSNPIPGEELRIGVIDYDSDPERFVFNYVAKSIFSGIKSSIIKSPDRKKKA